MCQAWELLSSPRPDPSCLPFLARWRAAVSLSSPPLCYSLISPPSTSFALCA